MPNPKKPKPVTPPKPIAKPPEEVVYSTVDALVCAGDDAITLAKAKEIIGWEELEHKDDSCDPEVSALYGKPVRLARNTKNRYITGAHLLLLKQEHLQRRWRLNGETIVVGRHGNLLSGQHRIIAFILAVTDWAKDESGHWKAIWPTEPVFETIIITGIDEGDDTFKTLNSGKAMTFAEALYRSEFFSTYAPAKRKPLATITDYAVKLLWGRTGLKKDAWAPRRSISEAMDFLGRHQKLIDASHHVYQENSDGGIGGVCPPGTATGLLYLMASMRTNGDAYRKTIPPNEAALDLATWDKACEYWVLLAGGNPDVQPVKDAIAALYNEVKGETPSAEEKTALAIKGWLRFVAGKPIMPADLELAYKPNTDTGERQLVEFPVVGGIDLGPGAEVEEGDDKPDEDNPEEIEARKAAIDKAKEEAKKPLARKVDTSTSTVPISNGKPDAEVAVDIIELLKGGKNLHIGVLTDELDGVQSSAQTLRVLQSLQQQKKVKALPGDRWEGVVAKSIASKVVGAVKNAINGKPKVAPKAAKK